MRIRQFILLFFLAALASLAAVSAAQAQQPTPPVTADDVNAVARQLYCPVCENIPLDVCPTQACAQWRALIREKLEQGWSEDQIKDYFVNQYGDRVLAEPPRRGLNWLVYVLPPVLILAAAYLVVRVLQGMRRVRPAGEDAPPPSAPGIDADYLNRLEEELKKRE